MCWTSHSSVNFGACHHTFACIRVHPATMLLWLISCYLVESNRRSCTVRVRVAHIAAIGCAVLAGVFCLLQCCICRISMCFCGRCSGGTGPTRGLAETALVAGIGRIQRYQSWMSFGVCQHFGACEVNDSRLNSVSPLIEYSQSAASALLSGLPTGGGLCSIHIRFSAIISRTIVI